MADQLVAQLLPLSLGVGVSPNTLLDELKGPFVLGKLE
jgi:hypothetical protein